MEKFVDDALGLLQESMKAFSREVVNNTLRLLHSFSVLLLALIPAQTSSQLGIQDVNSMPRGPEVPSWMDNGVSSFNSFLQEEDIDSGSDLDEDDNISSDRRRGRSSLWRRCVRQLFTPLRVLTTGSKRAAKAKWLPRKLGSTGAGIGAAGVAESDGSACVARSSSSERFNRIYSMAKSHLSGVKDYVMPKQAGDRRRGVIEDLQFLVELAIERAFEVLRNMICLMLSPFETVKLILWWFFLSDPTADDAQFVEGEGVILGDADPSFLKPYKGGPDLNTDGRTCGDVITSLGYPYEALRVTTEDGHILLLERIPRANSQKVLYLQHGLLDSSLGWVSNGVVGSQAFAAYDQGYDVFLGNFRGSASRDHHVNPNISTRSYWNYSVNEHGAQDIPAMLEKIHEIKMEDLKATIRDNESAEGRHGSDCSTSGGESEPHMPYALCGVAHSLGGASILMYVVLRKLESKPHRLSRLILLSPAGFHEHIPWICKPLQYIFPVISPLASLLVPGLYIPTRIGRALFNKLARDLESYPAIRGLLQLLLSLAVGGDSSNWVGALGISHYNMDDMPGTSFKVTQHLLQMARSKRFCMFDFGSVRANIAAYGIPEPLDIGAHYEVIDIPVDVVAGVKDYVIPRSMVRKHFDTLKKVRCDASYDEFEYAHLDFTFAHREELLAYVMSRLLLVKPPSRPPSTLSTSDLPVASQDEAPDATYSGFKAKSFKRKLNSLLLSRKPRSRKGAGLLREKSTGITPVSSPVNEISEVSSADQDVLVLGHDSEMVSAGSVATDKHEESFRESRTPPLTEDGLGVASTKELQDRLNCPQSMTESLYQDDSPKCTESHPKREKNSVSELQSRRNPRGGQGLLSNNRPRSITGLILWTLSNCYSRPTMQVEDSDE